MSVRLAKIVCRFLSLFYSRRLVEKYHILSSQIYTYSIFRKAKKKISNVYIDKSSEVTGCEYWTVGEKVYIHKNCRIDAIKYLDHDPQLVISNGVSIGNGTHIGAINSVFIGENALISANCLIIDHSHGDNHSQLSIAPAQRQLVSKGKCYIGANVWMGENVIVLPNVTIGDGAIIGAGAVVTHDIPSMSVAVGNPARIIK